MMSTDKGRQFQRRMENFVCVHCSAQVRGNGYTNHCPHCLFSQHVDVAPGDRKSSCGGLMEPKDIEKSRNDTFRILHHCVRCGYEKWNKIGTNDDFETILLLQKKTNQKRFYAVEKDRIS